jgi:hypothetical protein
MKTERSLPRVQEPASSPHPEPDQPSVSPRSSFLKIYLNIMLPSTPLSSKWPPFPRFLHQNPVCISHRPLTCYVHRPYILLYLHTRIIFGEEYIPLSSPLCRCLHIPVTASLLSSNILLNILFSNTLSLRFSLNVNDQVSHP